MNAASAAGSVVPWANTSLARFKPRRSGAYQLAHRDGAGRRARRVRLFRAAGFRFNALYRFRVDRAHERDVAHLIGGEERLHLLVQHPAAALRGVAQQQLAVLAERDQTGVVEVEVGAPRNEADHVARREKLPVGKKRRCRDRRYRYLRRPWSFQLTVLSIVIEGCIPTGRQMPFSLARLIHSAK